MLKDTCLLPCNSNPMGCMDHNPKSLKYANKTNANKANVNKASATKANATKAKAKRMRLHNKRE